MEVNSNDLALSELSRSTHSRSSRATNDCRDHQGTYANSPTIMPLVRIEVIKGRRSPEQLRKLADVVQEVMLQKFNAPARDRYQVCLIVHRTNDNSG